MATPRQRIDTTRDINSGEAARVALALDMVTRRAINKPADVATLLGYLGKGRSEEHLNLYKSQAFDEYIEMAVKDMVEAFSETDDGTAGQSVIWVRREAILVWCKSVRASSFEDGSGPGGEGPQWPRG